MWWGFINMSVQVGAPMHARAEDRAVYQVSSSIILFFCYCCLLACLLVCLPAWLLACLHKTLSFTELTALSFEVFLCPNSVQCWVIGTCSLAFYIGVWSSKSDIHFGKANTFGHWVLSWAPQCNFCHPMFLMSSDAVNILSFLLSVCISDFENSQFILLAHFISPIL